MIHSVCLLQLYEDSEVSAVWVCYSPTTKNSTKVPCMSESFKNTKALLLCVTCVPFDCIIHSVCLLPLYKDRCGLQRNQHLEHLEHLAAQIQFMYM